LNRLLILLRSDTHGGHKLGLLSPSVTLNDEDEHGNTVPYTPRLTRTQEWLWSLYQKALAKVAVLADSDPVISLHLGDVTHGLKYPHQLITTSIANQVLIGIANEVAVVESLPTLTSIRIAEGTDSHELHDATSPHLIATYLQGTYPHINTQVVRHHLLTIGSPCRGLVEGPSTSLDIAHHGPHPGSRNWLRGNVARWYLKSMMMDCLDLGETPPTLVLRGHRHTYIPPITERIYRDHTLYTSTLILLPSLCGISHFARQVTQSNFTLTVGLLALEIIDSTLHRIHPFVTIKDMRSREEIAVSRYESDGIVPGKEHSEQR